MPNHTLRVALIGQGFMGRAHSNAFLQVRRFFDVPFEIERKVICARDRNRLEPMAATWGWSEVETDWRAVVARSDIDLIDIAAPNALHAPMAIAGAEAGKIVLCEKPMAASALGLRRSVRQSDLCGPSRPLPRWDSAPLRAVAIGIMPPYDTQSRRPAFPPLHHETPHCVVDQSASVR